MSIGEVAISVVIQAGGRSRRLGVDKALVPLGGRPLIEHVLARVKDLGDECLITTNRSDSLAYLGVRLTPDPEESIAAGTLNGLATALQAAAGEHVLVVGCDMPFIEPRLAAYLIDVALRQSPAAIAVPRWNQRLEPLLSVYPRTALNLATEVLKTSSQRIGDVLDRHPLRIVEAEELSSLDPQGLSFFNVNTRQDLAKAEAIYDRLSRRPS